MFAAFGEKVIILQPINRNPNKKMSLQTIAPLFAAESQDWFFYGYFFYFAENCEAEDRM